MRLLAGVSAFLTPFQALYSWWVSTTYPFAGIGRNLSIHFTADLSRDTSSQIKIGNSVRVEKGAWIYVAAFQRGVDGPPSIIIDDNCLIARYCQIGARNRIHIESDVTLSGSVIVVDHLHAYENITLPISDQGLTAGGTVRIERGSWIGHGAAIICDRGELVLGRNCVVAANAVVTRSVPPFSVVAGNPARIVRQYDFQKSGWTMGSVPGVVAERAGDASHVIG